MASRGVLKPRPTFFQNRVPAFPGAFPLADALVLRNTLFCFKNDFSVCTHTQSPKHHQHQQKPPHQTPVTKIPKPQQKKPHRNSETRITLTKLTQESQKILQQHLLRHGARAGGSRREARKADARRRRRCKTRKRELSDPRAALRAAGAGTFLGLDRSTPEHAPLSLITRQLKNENTQTRPPFPLQQPLLDYVYL
jgi:hypothetical protein